MSQTCPITIDAGGDDPTPDMNDGRGSRVFQIHDRTNDLKTVAMSRLTLTGGDASGPGGAILAPKISTLVDCLISGNATSTRSQLGGGRMSTARRAASTPNSLTLTGCTITKNAAVLDEGGGIRKRYGSLVVEDCMVSDNTAFTLGGGLSGADGGVNIQIRSSTFSDNSTDVFYGGGIFVYSGNFSLTDSTVSGNAADYRCRDLSHCFDPRHNLWSRHRSIIPPVRTVVAFTSSTAGSRSPTALSAATWPRASAGVSGFL